jgi:hypothetical protein
MLPHDTRRKIENIVAGGLIEGEADHCTAIRNRLCSRFATSTTVKKDFEGKSIVKKEQALFIENYCTQYSLWIPDIPGENRYLTRGGEAEVYLHIDNRHVLKFNDAIYYATWLEFLNSVLLHNLIFEDTSYNLLGFVKKQDILYAVLEQLFIFSDAQAEIEDIKKFLEFNGFENNRRNDYVHNELGLILEDMHDENVLVNSEKLFFIDSVFYTISPASK